MLKKVIAFISTATKSINAAVFPQKAQLSAIFIINKFERDKLMTLNLTLQRSQAIFGNFLSCFAFVGLLTGIL